MDRAEFNIKVKYVIVAYVGVALVTIASTYGIAGQKGKLASNSFIISETFEQDPARAVATFGLAIAAFLLLGVFSARYMRSVSARSKFLFEPIRTRLSFLCCIGASLGMIGVAAVSNETSLNAHAVFGFIMFSCGIGATAFFTLEDAFVFYDKFAFVVILRVLLVLTAAVSFILMVTSFKSHDVLFTANAGSIASSCEVMIVGSLATYMISLIYDFKDTAIVIKLYEAPLNKDDDVSMAN